LAAFSLHPAMDSREPRENGSQAPGTVLVVEDDEATRAFLLDNLAADGFRVAGASGAAEGLRAIEVRQPALVVLDLVLEDGSGLALLDRVRASDGLSSRIDPDLPVIVLSGRAGDADRVRSFARGADDHLCKPTRYLLFRFVEPHSGLRGSLHSGGRGCRPDEPHARDRSPHRPNRDQGPAGALPLVHRGRSHAGADRHAPDDWISSRA
jgi:CheY-like chemotaxis protein